MSLQPEKRGFFNLQVCTNYEPACRRQGISDFQHTFSFSSQSEQFDVFYQRFLGSDLGKIYQAVPWENLVRSFGLKRSKKGPASIFSPQGKLALMLLKHYGGCSDRRLMEGLNGNLEWQFFCGIYLGEDRLTNFKVISEIRCELSKNLDIDKVQQAFYGHWSPHIAEKHSLVMDATWFRELSSLPYQYKTVVGERGLAP